MNTQKTSVTKRGLLERLDADAVICAEGYLFELERRGYLQAGPFVPEVVLEHPEAVTRLHEDFVHAGSEVVEAFTYYAHRQKLRVIGREDILEKINRQALRLAKDVAERNGGLMAGNICNTNAYEASDRKTHDAVRAMFEEQIGWAVEEGADFLIAETIDWYGEAEIALDVMRRRDCRRWSRFRSIARKRCSMACRSSTLAGGWKRPAPTSSG